jgi:3-phenylpropionate/trans-cinnamate dioxygenase ferredoxin reductase subunit
VHQALLADGRRLDIDFVIVGVGVSPDIGLAQAAGLAIENGIRTDELGRTSEASIWAVGDCASFPFKGGRIRLESVGHAIDHGECIAENLLGANKPYVAKPWFWSDQYDVKLQIAGLNAGYDRTVTRSGAGASQSIWYFAGDRLLAIDAMNDSRSYMAGKRMIETGLSVPPNRVSDTSIDVKVLMSEAVRMAD